MTKLIVAFCNWRKRLLMADSVKHNSKCLPSTVQIRLEKPLFPTYVHVTFVHASGVQGFGFLQGPTISA
jgi:hypothetical protein